MELDATKAGTNHPIALWPFLGANGSPKYWCGFYFSNFPLFFVFFFVCLEVLNVWKLIRKGRKGKGFRQREKIKIEIEKGGGVELDLRSFTRIITRERVITITVVCVFTPQPKPKALPPPPPLWRTPASLFNKQTSLSPLGAEALLSMPARDSKFRFKLFFHFSTISLKKIF